MVAKEPVPGRVKTRLCPPCTPEEAAQLAEAALADTLTTCCDAGADGVVVALDGRPGAWLPAGVTVVDQGSGSFDQRLARAWEHVGGPALQIGMDTPQVTADLLAASMDQLATVGTDAVLGPAQDGGWWALGLRRADPSLLVGVPTSRADTGSRQLRRLVGSGRRTRLLAILRDVDTWSDVLAVAAGAPGTRFTSAVERVAERVDRPRP